MFKKWVQATRKKRTQSRGDDLWQAFFTHTLTLTWNHSSLLACFLHFLSSFPPSSPLSVFYSLCLLSSALSAWHPFHHGGETAEDGILEAAPKASPWQLQCDRKRRLPKPPQTQSHSAGRMTEWNEVVSKWVMVRWGIKKIRMETEEDEPLI